MDRIHWKPGTMIYPLPAVMVSCGNNPENYNIITIAWTGTTCTNPPMCYISVRPNRHSYQIIKDCGDFVINLTNEKLAKATDWCGVKSGKDFNKFEEMKLTPAPAKMVSSPIILESPVNVECKLKDIIPLGSHDMFLAEVLNVSVDPQYLDTETGAFQMQAAGLINYAHGNYYKTGDKIGKFGFSVQKKKSKKKSSATKNKKSK